MFYTFFKSFLSGEFYDSIARNCLITRSKGKKAIEPKQMIRISPLGDEKQ
jgi:hypothetical protein